MTIPRLANVTVRLQAWLSHAWLPGILAGLAMVLTLPSIQNGLVADDFYHRAILLGGGDAPTKDASLTGMFMFLDGEPERNLAGVNRGALPWWTYEGLRISFFRPLSELTHLVDYRLWPDRFRLMHVHNLVWFGALVLLAARLYRKVMAPLWVAGLAAFLFAVDDAHGFPAGWLANRNAVVSAVFGVLTLLVHLRWRRDGWRPGAILAPLCLLTSLLASEAGVATGAYILAYEVTMDRHTVRSRLVTLTPYAVIGFGWWLAYGAMGFGAWGSGAYLNPGQDPGLFARALVERMPVLLCGQWLNPDADVYSHLYKPAAYGVLLTAIVLVLALTVALYPLLRRDATARFWGLGMLLSLVPVCATFPMNRLLVFAGVGAMGLIAQFLAGWVEQAAWLPSAKAWRGLAGVLAVLLFLNHCIVSPLMLPLTSTRLARLTRLYLEAPAADLSSRYDLEGKTVFILNPPSAFLGLVLPFILAGYGENRPSEVHVLSSGLHKYIDVTRTDLSALEIAPQDGFASAEVDRLFRGPHNPLHVGQRIELDAMTIEILSLTRDERPARVRFVFARPPDDPSYFFVRHQAKGLARFDLPEVGQTVRVPWYIRPHL